jgi:hypothetical protein
MAKTVVAPGEVVKIESMPTWEEEFDEKFGHAAPEVAFKNWEFCDSVKVFIQSLLDKQKKELEAEFRSEAKFLQEEAYG